MTLRRPGYLAAGVAALAFLLGSGSAAASGVSDRGAPTSRQRQSLSVQLDLAKASDVAIEAEANRLAAAVEEQRALWRSAEAAVAAARLTLAQASASLADHQRRAAGARQLLVSRAVSSYMSGGPVSMVSLVLQGGSVQEEFHRQQYLTSEQQVMTSSISTLRAAQHAESDAHKVLTDAQRFADDRSALAAQQVALLATAERSNELAHTALQFRISALLTESPDLAALDGQVQTLVLQQDAAATLALSSLLPGGTSRPGGFAVSRSRTTGAGLIWPLHGPVTSEFGPRWGGFHPGLDIAPPYGTPIAAAKDGVVVFAGYNGGYGNFVVIDHGSGLATAYAHQSRIAVALGDVVRQGQIIGYEGSTGYSTGPHLHFEVRVNGAAQNPRDYEVGAP